MGTDYSRNLVRGQVLMPTSNANTIQIGRSTAGLEILSSLHQLRSSFRSLIR